MQNSERAAFAALIGLLLAGGAIIWIAGDAHAIFFTASIFNLVAILALLRRFRSIRTRAITSARLSGLYERGIERLQGNWQGQGSDGHAFVRANHLYQEDLNILGKGSLFELLSTTRSTAGAERLAAFLLDSADLTMARRRQSAVRELRLATKLRESLILVGKYAFQECDAKAIRHWLQMPVLEVAGSVRWLLLVSSGLCGTVLLLLLAGFSVWHLAVLLALPLLIQGGVCAVFLKRVRPLLNMLPPLAAEFLLLKDGVSVMQRQAFTSQLLNDLVQHVQNPDALAILNHLQRLVTGCNKRRNEVLYPFSLLLGAGTQLALAIEHWRKLHGKDLERWLDAWAEFDALNALAGYAYEHPDHVFPDLVEGATVFQAEDLRHPLLSARGRVGNDLCLDPAAPFHLLSGSNMAGKSTWLRAIGINAVLAAAGAPVCATKARISLFTVCASIAVADSLLEGKSKFLAEVERLRETVLSAERTGPVLFLIDEILSGTNAADRKVIAEAFIRTLVNLGAVGVISTHDDALVSIADVASIRGVNMHLGSKDPGNPLDFDYRLKSGSAQQSNAIAIIRMIGVRLPNL